MTSAEKHVIKIARLVLAAYDLMNAKYPNHFRPLHNELRAAVDALDEQS